MTTPIAPAFTPENVANIREKADEVLNLCRMLEDGHGARGVPAELREAVNDACNALGPINWHDTTPERIRVMLAWCELLPMLHLVAPNHDPNNDEWHWSSVRCLLAGAGYEAHTMLATQLVALYPQCPLDPAESFEVWQKELAAAHQKAGLPACLAHLPWSALRKLPKIPKDSLDHMSSSWLNALALLHILKHTRTWGDEVRVMLGGSSVFFRRDHSSNTLNSNPRTLASILAALRAERVDGRTAEVSPLAVGIGRIIPHLTYARLLPALPLTAAPGTLIVGPFTRLVPDSHAEGWFQHGQRMENAWLANNGTTRTFTGTDETVMGYAWKIEAATEAERMAFDTLAAAVPATYDVDTPLAILHRYQPNILFNVANPEAYASLLDAVLVMSVMRDTVRGSRREFPLLWVLPEDPTPEGSSNQGKTAAVGALANCMTPGIIVSRPPDSNSAPDLRATAGALREIGTVALEEWTMPKNQTHLLAARNLQALVTGGAVAMGEVLENNPSPVMLRQPIVAGAKCVTLPIDVENRSVFLFMRTLTREERARVNQYDKMVSGEVALRMRLAALDLVNKYGLRDLTPVGSEAFRFPLHMALAAKLYALRTDTTGPGALRAVEDAAREMYGLVRKHSIRSDESGLQSELESGEFIRVRITDLVASASTAELMTICDTVMATDAGRATSGQILKCFASALNSPTVRGMLAGILGYVPRANERALGMALRRDLLMHMPNETDIWRLPDQHGLDGWHVKRVADGASNTPRFRLLNDHPSMKKRTPAE